LREDWVLLANNIKPNNIGNWRFFLSAAVPDQIEPVSDFALRMHAKIYQTCRDMGGQEGAR
jgi:hypothetical protein